MKGGLSIDRRLLFPPGRQPNTAGASNKIDLGLSVRADDQPVLTEKMVDRYEPDARSFKSEPNSKQQSIGTLLIDSRFLFREGFKIILRHNGYSITAEVDDVAAALALAERLPSPRLVLYGLHLAGADTIRSLMALRKAFAESRLVVQADPAVDPVLVQRSFEIGVDGWLTMDVLPGIIRRSLDLVMLGERVFPSNAIMTYVAEGRCVASAPAASSKNTFSFHETQILRCLVSGYSNKMIARQLNLAESTIKALLKALFRKIGVGNRTQAAIWANSERTRACRKEA